MAGLFGRTMLTTGANQPMSDLETYLEGLKRWEDATRRMNVDVQLISHPLFDGLFDKLELLKTRKPGDRHPMVVGTDAYQRLPWAYAGVAALAQMARRHGSACRLDACAQVMMSGQIFVSHHRGR